MTYISFEQSWFPPHYQQRTFYTVKQVAEICSMSETAVRRSIDNGYLRATKHGAILKVLHDELGRFCEGLANGEYADVPIARVPEKYRRRDGEAA